MDMNHRVWLTWEIQRRNRTLSSKLNTKLYEITMGGPRWKRYPSLIARTVKILYANKPSFVYTQNPSLVLAAIVVFYGKISNSSVIIDAHNAGIFPLEGKSFLLNKIAMFINSHSDKVIVSNTALRKYINKNEKDVFAIPDPIPIISKHSDFPLNHDKLNLVFICSWAPDEPYEEVLSIAENLSDIVNIYITGNSRNKEKSAIKVLPNNVILTGFLSDNAYEDLLVACDAIMVLTKRDNCLVCGAYEGVAVEKPMLISNTTALVEHFNKGCIYTDNTGADIEDCIRKLYANIDGLALEMQSLKKEQEDKMDMILREFNRLFP